MYYVKYVFDPEVNAGLLDDSGFAPGYKRNWVIEYAGRWSLNSLNGFTPSTALGTLDPRSPAFLAWWDAEVRFLIDLVEQRVKSLRDRGVKIKLGYHGACTLCEYP